MPAPGTRLQPRCRLRFDYPESWGAEIRGDRGTEEQLLLHAAGTVEGSISGEFRGTNYPRRRTDGTFLADFRGVIETSDGATVLWECHGFGRTRAPEYVRQLPTGRQGVAAVTHLSDHEASRRLNDVVCVGAGVVHPTALEDPSNRTDLILDVAELNWEATPE